MQTRAGTVKRAAIFFASLLFAAAPCFAQSTKSGHGTTSGPVTINAAAAVSSSIVQYCANSNFATSLSCGAWSVGNLTAGNFLIGFGYGATAVTLGTTMTGCGLTWTTQSTGAANGTEFIATAPIISTAACGTAPAISGSGSSNNIAIEVVEATGIINTVDGTPGFASTNNSGGTFSGASTTTTAANDLVIAYCFEPAANAITLNAGYTQFVQQNISGAIILIASTVLGSPGATNASYTGTTFVTYITGIIAMKP